jgi:hypothetical protein
MLIYKTDYRHSIPDFARQVTIIINEDNPELTASFTVAECMLTETSDHFKGACGGDWQGSTSRTLRLLDVDVEAFNSYVCWANRKVLAIDFDFSWAGEQPPYAMAKLVTLYLLADRLANSKLRNAVIGAIIEVSDYHGASYDTEPIQIFPPHMTGLIWSALAKGRALRRLLINYYIDNVTAEALGPHCNECHPDFIKSLAMASLEGGPFEGEASNALAACDEFKYHEHIDTQQDDCESADYWMDELFNYES